MAHALTLRSNGFTEMAFVGETPWHGLGQELQAGASIEEWLTAAGMEWRIQRSKVRYHFGHDAADFATWDDKHVLFRSDTKKPLGLVSPQYKPVQPREVVEFFRDLVENAGYQLHTAGTIHGGRKMWALAKVAEGTVGKADKIGGFLLLSTACDGTMETEARFTTVRVVCNNTLTMARGEGVANVKIGHRSRFDADKVKQQMGLATDRFASFLDEAERLAMKRVTQAEAEGFVRELLRPAAKVAAKVAAQAKAAEAAQVAIATAADASDDFARLMQKPVILGQMAPDSDTTRAPKGEAEILRLFAGKGRGSDLGTAQGTAWGLVNAVTQYVDHESGAKSVDYRLDRAFFGTGEDLKNRAMESALAL